MTSVSMKDIHVVRSVACTGGSYVGFLKPFLFIFFARENNRFSCTPLEEVVKSEPEDFSELSDIIRKEMLDSSLPIIFISFFQANNCF